MRQTVAMETLRARLSDPNLSDFDHSCILVSMVALAEEEERKERKRFRPKGGRRSRSVEAATSPCSTCDFPLSQQHHVYPFHVVGEAFGNRVISLCPNCHTTLHLLERFDSSPTADIQLEALLGYAAQRPELEAQIVDIANLAAHSLDQFVNTCRSMARREDLPEDRSLWWEQQLGHSLCKRASLRLFLVIADQSRRVALPIAVGVRIHHRTDYSQYELKGETA